MLEGGPGNRVADRRVAERVDRCIDVAGLAQLGQFARTLAGSVVTAREMRIVACPRSGGAALPAGKYMATWPRRLATT